VFPPGKGEPEVACPALPDQESKKGEGRAFARGQKARAAESDGEERKRVKGKKKKKRGVWSRREGEIGGADLSS